MPRILLTAVAAVMATLPARADVPPPPGYVEACTVDEVRQDGETCVRCGDAYHGAPDACRDKLAPQGYTKRCRTRGASTWGEVWCKATAKADGAPARADETAPKPAVGEKKSSGCAGGGAEPWGLALALALGVALARRRGEA